MEDELICNFRKCRKRLTSYAWVTSCSHGTREFENSLVCPACDNTLPGKLDVIRVDLKPSEQFKSMVLCGNRPETIMEICTRALSFWNYQVHQERVYQEYLASKAREKAEQLEQYYEQIVNRMHAELNALKVQITSTKKKLEVYETKCKEISAKLTEKTRQHQKLQALYEALRRRVVTPVTMTGARDSGDSVKDDRMVHLSSRYELLGSRYLLPLASSPQPQAASESRASSRRSPPEREFTMRPNLTPLAGDRRDNPVFTRLSNDRRT